MELASSAAASFMPSIFAPTSEAMPAAEVPTLVAIVAADDPTLLAMPDTDVAAFWAMDANCVPVVMAMAPTLADITAPRSEEHTSELQSRENLVCRLLLEKKN